MNRLYELKQHNFDNVSKSHCIFTSLAFFLPGLKSPDMPVLENMTTKDRGRFLVPSPTKQPYTSLSSINCGHIATSKEVIVGGAVCHEISPPTISPIHPIATKIQMTKPHGMSPSKKARTVVEGAAAILAKSVAAAAATDVGCLSTEDNLAIQAPDVSSTEESSGTERETRHNGDKETHVTSSKSQELDTTKDDAAQIRDLREDVGDKKDTLVSDETNAMKKSKEDGKFSNIVTVPVYKKGKKQKMYKCHICGSVFGKPVHVKIHIAKKHGLQARKSALKGKVFVPGKREKIRTRSVSNTVMPGDRRKVYRRKWLEDDDEDVLPPPEGRKITANIAAPADKMPDVFENETKPSVDAASPLPKESESFYDVAGGSASMVPMMYSSRAYGHREGKSCGTYTCEFCRRVFHYRTWLTRHLETKHPGLTPTVSYKESPKRDRQDEPSPPREEPAGEFSEEPELSKEQIEQLLAEGKGKRLKIFPCAVCGRRFSSKKNVRRHKRIIHKILIRPRRTQLPFPPLEEGVNASMIPSSEILSQPTFSPKTVLDNRPSEQDHHTAAISGGMRKPRKNKSPSKRSRIVNSGEAFADSYLTFPIEQNPNPLSAFMPTKPVGFEMSASRHLLATGVKSALSSDASLPSTKSLFAESISSRRTGTPPIKTKSVTDASMQDQLLPSNVSIPHRLKQGPAVPPPSILQSEKSGVNIPSTSRHHLYQPKPLPPTTVMFGAASNSSTTNATSPKQTRPFNLGIPTSTPPYRPRPEKPISANPWSSCDRKPQPFVPRRPQQPDNSSDGHKERAKTSPSKSIDKIGTSLLNLRRESFATAPRALPTYAQVIKKQTDTLSVLNLKRKEPALAPPAPYLPVSEDGALDLSVSKKPKLEPVVEKPPPPAYSYPEPIDPDQPLDLSSSSSRINKSVLNPTNSISQSATSSLQHANPAPIYASNPRMTPPGFQYYAPGTSQQQSSYKSRPKYAFHHMSPASFSPDHPQQDPSRKRPGPKRKATSVQEMLQQQDTLLMKADKDQPIMSIKQMQQQSQPMQFSHFNPTNYRSLLPKTSHSGSIDNQLGHSSSSVSPQRPNAKASSPTGTHGVKQVSPHEIAAQVIKQAHAQYHNQSAALRPILPKPAATAPMFIGGQVVAGAAIPLPQSNRYGLPVQQQQHKGPDDKGFACNVCEVAFTSIKALAKHVVVHAQEWPYKCEFCVRLYQDTEELISHRTQLHHVGKTFSCGVCKRDFAYKSNLRKHQTDVHYLVDMNYRELGPKELRAHNFTDPDKIKTGPPELPPRPDRISFIEQEMARQTAARIGKMKLPLKTGSASSSPTRSTPSPRKMVPNNPQRHHPFAYARQIGYLKMLNDPRNQEILQEVTAHRCTKCSKEFTETAEFHGHIMECALEGMPERTPSPSISKETKTKDSKHIDAEKHIDEATEKRMKMKAYTKSKKKAIQQRQHQSGPGGKRQRAKPGLKIYNPNKYTGRRASTSVEDVHACPGCDKKFYFINKLERHMRMCPNREKFLKGKKVVVEHAREQNANKDILKMGHCCPFCTRQFTYLKSLKKHALTCEARNPDEEDPIRLVEENFQKAQKMAKDLQKMETSGKLNGAETAEELTKQQQSKNPSGNAKKRRRRKKRTDVIPKPKKRKRVSLSTESQDDPKAKKMRGGHPREAGHKKGRKLVVKMGQQKDSSKKQLDVNGLAEPMENAKKSDKRARAQESAVPEKQSITKDENDENHGVNLENQSPVVETVEQKPETVLDEATGQLIVSDEKEQQAHDESDKGQHTLNGDIEHDDGKVKENGDILDGNHAYPADAAPGKMDSGKSTAKHPSSDDDKRLPSLNDIDSQATQTSTPVAEQNKESMASVKTVSKEESNPSKMPVGTNENGLHGSENDQRDKADTIRCPETGTVMVNENSLVASN